MKKICLVILALGLILPPAFASQHDYIINNGTGNAVRADINSVLQAIVTNNSGSVAPSSTFPNQLWYDTSTGILRIRNNANDAWVALLDGSNLCGLANITSGAGVIPITNIPYIPDIKLASGVGTSANNLVKLDASGKLPAVDGSLLTHLPVTPQHTIGNPSGGKSINTVYQAATDGFVVATYSASNNTGYIYSDAANPPTVSVAMWSSNYGIMKFCAPIKAGNYWKFTSENGSGDCNFIPLS